MLKCNLKLKDVAVVYLEQKLMVHCTPPYPLATSGAVCKVHCPSLTTPYFKIISVAIGNM